MADLRHSYTLTTLAVSRGVQVLAISVGVTFSGLIGLKIAGRPELATIPMTVMLASAGIMTLPISAFFSRFDRRIGFTFGALFGAVGALLASFAAFEGRFLMFCMACFLIGIYHSAAQYYRFAAADAVAPERSGQAVSVVILAGVAGAFLGPPITAWSQEWVTGKPYIGPFLSLAAVLIPNALFLSMMKLPRTSTAKLVKKPTAYDTPDSLWTYNFLVGTSLVAGAYAVMSYVMTAAPLAIVGCGLSPRTAATGIQWHLVAMFLPSVATGILYKRFGLNYILVSGCVSFLISLAVFSSDWGATNFYVGLIMLGVGWNFTYYGGTMILLNFIPKFQQMQSQGTSELITWVVSASVSGFAGSIYHYSGWKVVLVSASAIAGVVVLATFGASRPSLRVTATVER